MQQKLLCTKPNPCSKQKNMLGYKGCYTTDFSKEREMPMDVSCRLLIKNGILIKNLAILLYGKEEENGKEKREGIASHIRICCFIFRSWHIV